MRFEFTNDELFALCAIGGCTEAVGVANNFIAMEEEELLELSKSIVVQLENNGYIHKEDDEYKLSDSARKIVDLISDSDETYIISDGENEDYVFVKEAAMHMQNVEFENCFIEVFDARDEVKELFKSKFDFFRAHTDSVQYMLSIPSDTMDKAIGKAEDGKIDEAIKILDGDDFEKDEIINMLNSIIFPQLSKIVICRKSISGRNAESIYKICGTDKGAWIVKISTTDEGVNTLVYKATDDDITRIIFEV